MSATISLCMIVKNEEKNLKACLNGYSALADEIIIVDTGSTDRTVEIAKEAGAIVVETVWESDFS
ncbi:MAG: glycosyltransferase, partial [Fibrobacteres bacterium]|nr:glycosyltransferase [Fibrobacterota bacterium]